MMPRERDCRAWLACAWLLATAGCSHPASPSPASGLSPPPLVHVFGRVLDYQTNLGVPGATIAFYITGYDTTAGTVPTDASGFYTIMLPPGRYNPRINGTALPNAGDIVPGPAGTQYLADYYVNGGDCVTFYGTVRDAATAGFIPGVTVSLVHTAQTAADGSYRLELGCPTRIAGELPPFGIGTIFMSVTAAGYTPAQPYGNRREFLRGLYRVDVALARSPATTQ